VGDGPRYPPPRRPCSTCAPPIRRWHYLVGTPKGRLTRLEQELLLEPWHKAREGVQVKLLAHDGELYVFAESHDRIAKERGMRKRQLKRLWGRLHKLATMQLTRKELLMKLGAARSQYPAAWRLVDVTIDDEQAAFTYQLNRERLAHVRRREGRYLLRTNLTGNDRRAVAVYIQLVQVEEAFKNLKGDLAIRPIYHQHEPASRRTSSSPSSPTACTPRWRSNFGRNAPGLTPRSVLDKFAPCRCLMSRFRPRTTGN